MKARTSASLAAEADFRAAVEAQGGMVLEPSWLGVRTGHRVRCPEGHESSPQPQYLKKGGGICSTCGYASRDPKRPDRSYDTEARFRAAVDAQGGTILEATWKGTDTPHRVRCAEGHEAAPRPANVLRGQGFCVTCAWSSQDVLYVVFNPSAGTVKFGITSGDPAGRLKEHRTAGFTEVVSVRQGLPKGRAFGTEQAVIKDLRASGIRPVHGHEYFDGIHTMTILDLIDRRAR